MQKITEEDKALLNLIKHFCRTIGGAKDAVDHGYTADARSMQK